MIFKGKKFSVEKIKNVLNSNSYVSAELGMKEDWDMIHADVKDCLDKGIASVFAIDASCFDIPILKLTTPENEIKEFEVWEEFEYESTQENFDLHKESWEEFLKRKQT